MRQFSVVLQEWKICKNTFLLLLFNLVGEGYECSMKTRCTFVMELNHMLLEGGGV